MKAESIYGNGVCLCQFLLIIGMHLPTDVKLWLVVNMIKQKSDGKEVDILIDPLKITSFMKCERYFLGFNNSLGLPPHHLIFV